MAGRESQQLPGKEAGLFRQVVKFYESKQYKKGLKAAEQVSQLEANVALISYALSWQLVCRSYACFVSRHMC